jgi:hypothetical protein
LFFGLGLFIHNLRESSFREHIANVAKVTAVMMAVLVLVISPWVARNYHVTGVIFAGTRAGIWAGIWQGWGEFADNPVGAKQSDEDTMRIAKQELGVEKLDFGPEYDAVFRKKVIDTIKEHPVWCLSAVARRIPRTIVNFSELGINTLPIMREDSGILLAYLYRDAPVIGYMGAISGLIAGIKDGTFWGTAKSHPYGFLYFGLVGLFAFVPALLSIIGIWAMRKNWRSLILVATVPIYFSMLHMVLWTSGASKSILPASLGYIIFSAVALYYIYGRIKGIRGEVVELTTPLN